MKKLIIAGIAFFFIALADLLIRNGSGWEDLSIVGKIATVSVMNILTYIVVIPFGVMIKQWFKK